MRSEHMKTKTKVNAGFADMNDEKFSHREQFGQMRGRRRGW